MGPNPPGLWPGGPSETDAVSDLPFMGKDVSKKCVSLPAALPTIT